jgi:hypothetical protein
VGADDYYRATRLKPVVKVARVAGEVERRAVLTRESAARFRLHEDVLVSHLARRRVAEFDGAVDPGVDVPLVPDLLHLGNTESDQAHTCRTLQCVVIDHLSLCHSHTAPHPYPRSRPRSYILPATTDNLGRVGQSTTDVCWLLSAGGHVRRSGLCSTQPRLSERRRRSLELQ